MPIEPTAPVATAPADRLNLSATTVRGSGADISYPVPTCGCNCFADEA